MHGAWGLITTLVFWGPPLEQGAYKSHAGYHELSFMPVVPTILMTIPVVFRISHSTSITSGAG